MEKPLINKRVQIFFDDGAKTGLKTGVLKDITTDFVVVEMDYGAAELVPITRVYRICRCKE
jgi:hypothetical protein